MKSKEWQRRKYYGTERESLRSLMVYANITGGLCGHPSPCYLDDDTHGWELIVVWPASSGFQLERLP